MWLCFHVGFQRASSRTRGRAPPSDAPEAVACTGLLGGARVIESSTQKPDVCVSVPMAVPKTTAETLKHKINPSVGETVPQAVDVLLYTPGQMAPPRKLLPALPSEGLRLVVKVSPELRG